MVFVEDRHADFAGHHYVGAAAAVADFVDALARGEVFDLDLVGQNADFVFVKEREERHRAERFGTAAHRYTSVFVAKEYPQHSINSRLRATKRVASAVVLTRYSFREGCVRSSEIHGRTRGRGKSGGGD